MTNNRTDAQSPSKHVTEQSAAIKQAWSAPVLSYVGHVGDVLQGGGGKLSPTTADSGDNRKPSGQE